jgi:hypothetical protein
MTKPKAPKTIRSGHCGLRNPPDVHRQCLGVYSGYPCHCECHTTPEPAEARPPAMSLEDAVAAELDRQIEAMDLQDRTYEQFLQTTARAVIAIVGNDQRDTNPARLPALADEEVS